ncbi:ALF repeat-containing protein [Streptomyces sp. NPDC058011]|uniref:ALF repeat-containing protein n=1 Tax=Streptomyces sp. NPDC058011 TaxID=3346305 RepID=UPI0036EE5D21
MRNPFQSNFVSRSRCFEAYACLTPLEASNRVGTFPQVRSLLLQSSVFGSAIRGRVVRVARRDEGGRRLSPLDDRLTCRDDGRAGCRSSRSCPRPVLGDRAGPDPGGDRALRRCRRDHFLPGDGPWSRTAAEVALAGTDKDITDYIRTGWTQAAQQDDRARVEKPATLPRRRTRRTTTASSPPVSRTGAPRRPTSAPSAK